MFLNFVSISNTVSLDGYNPHKQKLFKVLNNYQACKGVLRAKRFTTAGLVLPQQERLGVNMKKHLDQQR